LKNFFVCERPLCVNLLLMNLGINHIMWAVRLNWVSGNNETPAIIIITPVLIIITRMNSFIQKAIYTNGEAGITPLNHHPPIIDGATKTNIPVNIQKSVSLSPLIDSR